MSSGDDQQVTAASRAVKKKKYTHWKEDDAVEIPLRTMQRWEKNYMVNSIPSDGHRDKLAVRTCTNFENDDSRIDQIGHANDIINLDPNNIDELSSNASIYDESPNDIASDGTDENAIDHDNADDISVSNNSMYEENDDSNDDDELCQEHTLSQLYEKSKMSVDESVLIVLDLYLTHKWSKSSLKDTLSMLRKMLPDDNQLPKTVFKLFQFVHNLAAPLNINKHFYCKVCYNTIESGTDKCSSCNVDEKNFFLEFDIRQQIKYLFENRNLAEKLKPSSSCRNENVITDITDGSEYIRVNYLNHQRQKYDLTLVLNTDGLALVKSSKSHCWPLMFMICELPEHLRESFIITVGVWYDNACKPSMNTFLKPTCIKLKECFDTGISWVNSKTGETVISRITAPLIVADAPARAQLQNVLHYNGKYGCNICEIKMKRAERVEGKRNQRIYPFNENESKLRTGERMARQAQKALQLDKTHVKGVKGTAVISDIPLLDLGTCVFPEFMHSALLGIGRQFTDMWTEKPGPWSIKGHRSAIDNFLLSIRPPYFFCRMPRQITLCKFYKASEYYNFILFYSLPALVDYLPDQYLQHWMLFVKALFILLLDRIQKKPDLEVADALLKLFVKQTKNLYGDRHLSYNLHQLTHLALVVERWGPLWATSAFPFENFNGFLANSVHGTKHQGQEIVYNLNIRQGTQTLRGRVMDATALSEKIKTDELIGKVSKDIEFDNYIMELFASNDVNTKNSIFYARAKIHDVIYTSKIYKTTKTNSYTVQINFINNTVIYGSIRFFFKAVENNSLSFVLDSFNVIHSKMFYHRKMKTKIDHLVPIEENDESPVLIRLTEIKSMCHLIRVGDYLCKRPNLMKKNL